MSWFYHPYPLGETATPLPSPTRVTLANRANRQGARDTRRAPRSRLRLPVVVNPPVVYKGPGVVRPRVTNVSIVKRLPHSRLPKVIYAAKVYEPIQVYLTRPRDRVPPTQSRLSPPTVLVVPPLARPIRVTLVRIRPFPTDASVFKPAVINAAQGPQGGILIQFAQPPRQSRKTTSRLPKVIYQPVVAGPTYPIQVTLAPQRRGKPKSRISPPVVTSKATYGGPRVRLTKPLDKVPRTRSRLRPPVDLVDAADLGYVRTHLAYSRRGAPKSSLHGLVYSANIFEPIRGYLLPRVNVPPVHSKLSGPATLELGYVFGGPHVRMVAARDRNPKVISRLEPPVVVTAANIYGGPKVRIVRSHRPARTMWRLKPPAAAPPLARAIQVHLVRIKPRPVHSILRRPTTVEVVVALAYPTNITLAYSRRGAPKSRLQAPAVAAVTYAPIRGRLTPPRATNPKTISRLEPPTVVTQPLNPYPVSVTLAYSRRGAPKSHLLGVIYPGRVFRGIRGTLAPPRATNPHTISRLAPPTVVERAVVTYAVSVTLAPQRRGTPKSVLHPPVPPETFRSIQVYLAPSSRGKPKSFFVKTPTAYLAVELSGPEVTLVRIRPPRTMALLGPMGPPAVVYAPISVNLTYSRRGAPKSFLPQASLYSPVAKAEYDLKITLAPQRRGKPKSFLRNPVVVTAATPYFRREPATLVRIRPRRTLGILRPPVTVKVAFATPLQVTLAPQRRGVPHSFLRPPVPPETFRGLAIYLAPSSRGVPKSILFNHILEARVYAPIKVVLAPSTRLPRKARERLAAPAVVALVLARPTAINLAPSFRGTPKSRLEPPAVVNYSAIETTLRVFLAPSSRGKPRSVLLPPAVVSRFEDFGLIQTTLVRITPPPVHSRLRPPAVIGGGIAFYGPRVTLVRIRPKPTTYYLRPPNGTIIPCYGEVCGIDYAAIVCGEDYAAEVTGGDSAADAVSGSDSGAQVTGESGARGNVSGGDERREGC